MTDTLFLSPQMLDGEAADHRVVFNEAGILFAEKVIAAREKAKAETGKSDISDDFNVPEEIAATFRLRRITGALQLEYTRRLERGVLRYEVEMADETSTSSLPSQKAKKDIPNSVRSEVDAWLFNEIVVGWGPEIKRQDTGEPVPYSEAVREEMALNPEICIPVLKTAKRKSRAIQRASEGN